MTRVLIRAYQPDGTVVGDLPDAAGVQTQLAHNDIGVLTLTYPRNGINAALLDDDELLFAPIVDGVLGEDWYVLEQDSDDQAAAEGAARPVTVAGRGIVAVLERAIIYPQAHVPGGPVAGLDPHYAFTTATPGGIMAALIEAAHARGAIPELDYDFTDTLDSAGLAWPTAYTVTYDTGLDLMRVLQAMTDDGWCDYRTQATTLRLYVPDTIVTDRSGVILRLGREVKQGPRKRDRAPIRTLILAQGDGTALTERADTNATTRYGRREGFTGRGGITDQTTLDALAQASLDEVKATSEGFTLQLDPTAGEFDPTVDYQVGDWIRYDQRRLDATSLEPMRVRTIARTWGDAMQPATVSVELNDLFVEATLKLAKRVEGIVNGTAVPTAPTGGDQGADTLPPATPANLVLGGGGVLDFLGNWRVFVTASWSQPTTNTDGSLLTDLAGYRLRWREVGYLWEPHILITATSTQWSGVITPGAQVEVQVAAYDNDGNLSPWSASVFYTTPTDTTPPDTPSVPTVTPDIGHLRVAWDGLNASGGVQPTDLAWAEVHVGASSSFTPTTATRQAVVEPGDTVTVPAPYGAVSYVRLVAVDRAGNTSAPGQAGSGTPLQVGTSDLADNLITSAKIANSAVVAAKTAVAAIDPATGALTAGSVTAAQITAGAVTAVAIAAGAVATDKLTVASLDVSLVPNGGFEDPGAGGMPAAWTATSSAGSTPSRDTTSPNGGGACLKITNTATADNSTVYGTVVPVVPGSAYYVEAWYKASRAAAAGRSLRILFGQTNSDFHVGDANTTTVDLAANLAWPTTWTQYTGQLTPPAGYSYMRVVVVGGAAGDGSGYSGYWDDIAVKRVVGTAEIANASITTAKIGTLQVGDAQIGSMSVAKLTAGTLAADILVGARIKTGDTGARVEMNGTGLKAYNASNALTVAINSDGTAQFTGTINAATLSGVLTSGQMTIFNGVMSWASGLAQENQKAQLQVYTAPLAPVAGASMQSATALSHPYADIGMVECYAYLDTKKSVFFVQASSVEIDAADRLWNFYGTTSSGSRNFTPSTHYLRIQGGATGTNTSLGIETGSVGGGVNFFDNGVSICKYDVSGYVPCYATAYNVMSSREVKHRIADLPWSALQVVTGAAARRWQYRDDPEERTRFGPMAEDLPDELVHAREMVRGDLEPSTEKWLDTTSMVGVLWAAVHELAAEVAELRTARH